MNEEEIRAAEILAQAEAELLLRSLFEAHDRDPVPVLMVLTHALALHLSCCRGDRGADIFRGAMIKLHEVYDRYTEVNNKPRREH